MRHFRLRSQAQHGAIPLGSTFEPRKSNAEMNRSPEALKPVIIGAGPAGLTAAAQLCKAGIKPVVLEKDHVVGGISRTCSYKSYHFDIGGHRFFTKVKAVEDMWREVLKEDFLLRRRISRILYKGQFFDYPLRPFNALGGLGLRTTILVLVSYVRANLFPIRNERSFKDWVTNRFGERLFSIFFKTYTEKVWGIPCSEISADWAAQRIKGLSLKLALLNAFGLDRRLPTQPAIKTLIDSFHYPKLGPGMMWERVADIVEQNGGQLTKGATVKKIRLSANRVAAVEVELNGAVREIHGTDFICSVPIQELIAKLDPAPPDEVRAAASVLRYRDFLTVALIIDREHLFDDHWIYVHEPEVRVGRIQNFKNWSPYMVADRSKTCLGLEYFCFEQDGLWSMSDEQLIELAKDEIQALGLAQRAEIEDGSVVRMPKAYPVYDDTYLQSIATIRRYLESIENIQTVGRNGMHKYNNQDHSMLTAMLAVENILGAKHDLWSVNAEQNYLEETSLEEIQRNEQYTELFTTQPLVPDRLPASEATIDKVFARIDKTALATATGTVSSFLVLLTILLLFVIDGSDASGHVTLREYYFARHSPTGVGALVGFVYGFSWGFLYGWLFAYLHNLILGIYVNFVIRRTEARSLLRSLDYI